MSPSAARAVVVAWLACHWVYPSWMTLPPRLGPAAAVFAVFLILGAGLFYWLKPLLLSSGPEPELKEAFRLPQDKALWVLLVAVTAIRLYPLTLPIHYWSGGDEGVHMGLPALPFKLWARALAVPFPAVFWTAALAAFFFRKPLKRVLGKAARPVVEGQPLALALALAIACLYFFAFYAVIERITLSGHPSLPADLLRFPPLSKFSRAIFFAAFGISNLTARLPEYLFFLGSTVLMYKLAARWSRAAALTAAACFAFMPPFAYYSMRGSQTHGEIFFFILTAFFFASWAASGRTQALYWAAAAVGIGSLYRYTVPLLSAVLPAAVLLTYWVRRERVPWRVLFALCALLFVMIAPWMALYLTYGLRPYSYMETSSSLGLLLTAAASIPAGATSIGAGLLFAAAALSAARLRGAFNLYLWLWFSAYYAFITLDLADDSRLTLPLYPPLILWAAWMLDQNPIRWLGRGAAAAFAAYLAAVSLFVEKPEVPPEFTLSHSLQNEYIPLTAAAGYLNRLPQGSRLVSIDCSPGCFSLYLKNPRAVDWLVVDSKDFDSAASLLAFAKRSRADAIMYMAGTRLAFGKEKNPRLFEEFQSSPAFKPLAEYRLGANVVSIKSL